MEVEVLDHKHHPSPFTRGGLEVKSKVDIKWVVTE